MDFVPTRLPGVLRVIGEKRGDERGHLIRTHCAATFAAAGLPAGWTQSSVTATPARLTLRGMHLQHPPHAETKLVRCLTGRVWDCVVDLRPGSPTFGQWEGFELEQDQPEALYLPPGIAHGFLTLTDQVRLLYFMDADYAPQALGGIRWDDPDLAIAWPEQPRLVSTRDQALPPLAQVRAASAP